MTRLIQEDLRFDPKTSVPAIGAILVVEAALTGAAMWAAHLVGWPIALAGMLGTGLVAAVAVHATRRLVRPWLALQCLRFRVFRAVLRRMIREKLGRPALVLPEPVVTPMIGPGGKPAVGSTPITWAQVTIAPPGRPVWALVPAGHPDASVVNWS